MNTSATERLSVNHRRPVGTDAARISTSPVKSIVSSVEIRLTREDDWWVAEDVDTGVVSQGEPR